MLPASDPGGDPHRAPVRRMKFTHPFSAMAPPLARGLDGAVRDGQRTRRHSSTRMAAILTAPAIGHFSGYALVLAAEIRCRRGCGCHLNRPVAPMSMPARTGESLFMDGSGHRTAWRTEG